MVQVFTAADIGAFIRERRRELGLTQAELAERVGIGTTYLSHLENGKETAEIGKALYLLQMLGLNLFIEKRS
jgi:y4mF family transcriptional regulator